MKQTRNFLAIAFAIVTIGLFSAFNRPQFLRDSYQNDKIFDTVDVQPKFPGGGAGWKRFIQGFRYPSEAVERGVSGKIIISFIIEKDGTLTNPVVESSPGRGTDRAAVNLINKSPKWDPGLIKGEPVRTHFKQTISLYLQAQNKF